MSGIVASPSDERDCPPENIAELAGLIEEFGAQSDTGPLALPI